MHRTWIAVFAALVTVAFPASAQQVKVATGSATGTYHAEVEDLVKFCGLPIEEVVSKGSVDNIEKATKNEVHAFIVQTDALFAYEQSTRKLDNLKTIVALHAEEVHFLAPAQSRVKKYGVSRVEFPDVGALRGYTVGAIAGSGSLGTAEFIRDRTNGLFGVQPFGDEASMKAALDDGKIAAVVYVGGQPLKSVEAYGPAYKLLSVPDGLAQGLSRWFDPAKLAYSKMNAKGTSTIAVEALLVGRTLSDKAKVQTFADIRRCIAEKIGALQDDGHPKWAEVKPENHGKWTWMDLPAPPKAEAAAAPAKKKARK